MSTITQEIGVIPEPGHRGIDTRDDFVGKQEAYQDHQRDTLVGELNTYKDQTNTVASEVNINAIAASNSALAASSSASASSGSAAEALASKTSIDASEIVVVDAKNTTLAVAGIDYASFSMADGELIVGYYDETASVPSIVDGEFILTY